MDDRLESMYRRFTWRILSSFHWASFVFTHDQGLNLPGYLRVPDGASRPGVVLLLPGTDSAKEELYHQAIIDALTARPPDPAANMAAMTLAGEAERATVLNNLWNQARPMVGDWLAETL